jgi:hypothetical protein
MTVSAFRRRETRPAGRSGTEVNPNQRCTLLLRQTAVSPQGSVDDVSLAIFRLTTIMDSDMYMVFLPVEVDGEKRPNMLYSCRIHSTFSGCVITNQVVNPYL